MAKKPKLEDRQEYIKEKKRKYGENWREHIRGVDPAKKEKYKGGGMAGMRRYFRGGKV